MLHKINAQFPFEISVRGKALGEGVCPTLLYFAASAQESLFEDPLCQPSSFFATENTRVLSVDLPFHRKGVSAQEAISRWLHTFLADQDVFSPFFESLEKLLQDLLIQQEIDPDKFAVAGLSRGGFIALHLAARLDWIKKVLLYAPLTHLEKIHEFQQGKEHPLIQKWSLQHCIEHLLDKKIRCYIGNHDTRIDTDLCYAFLRRIITAAVAVGKRPPHVEMVMGPSVGYKGHGTLPHVFKEGIDWINKEFKEGQ